jgi:hypothetical protein
VKFKVKHNNEQGKGLICDFHTYLGFGTDSIAYTPEFSIEKVTTDYNVLNLHFISTYPGPGYYTSVCHYKLQYHVAGLSHLAAKKCANLGRLNGLTDDAIDQVLMHDHLLAVRFIINND